MMNREPTTVQQNNQNQHLDVSALTEHITRTVTSAVMDNLRAAGLLDNQTQQQTTVTQSQSSSTISSPILTASALGMNISPSLNFGPSSSAVLNSSTIPSQSSVAAHIEASKSGFVSAAIPLHARVPMKTKEKIWNNEFVEFSTLYDEDSDDITISLKSGKLTPKGPSKKKFMTIEEWTDAFNVFAAVYRIKFPEQSEQLSSYLNTVRKISNENGNWYYYDTNFRRIRHSIGLQWDQIHSELYVTALTRKLKQPFRQSRDLPASGRSRTVIKGTCNRFNRGIECSGCDYKHICRHCGGKHSGYRCWREHSSRYHNSSHAKNNQQGFNPGASPSYSKQTKLPVPAHPGKTGNTK
ncbi:MAG: hypothetical protein AB2693_14195 [Candidatus Thiodiazotropha sp.]